MIKYALSVTAIVVSLFAGSFGLAVNAQNDPVLEKDPPSVNASETVQTTIRPGDTLPPNGTATISTTGTNDIDFKGTPPAGITVIIDNETATVTNQVVDIQDQTPAPAAAPAPAATPPPAPAAEESSTLEERVQEAASEEEEEE